MWQTIWDWFEAHPAVWTALAAGSVLMFLGTLIALPLIVARIPADYFDRAHRVPPPWARQHPAARLVVLIAKNALGVVLILAGLAMLVLPGQGLVTILIGLMLTNFPGKFRSERWLVGRGPVLRAINWMRRRAGRPALVPPGGAASAQASVPGSSADSEPDSAREPRG